MNNCSPFYHFAKNIAFPIQPWRCHCCDVKLTAVCIGSAIGQGYKSRSTVICIETFVWECLTVNTDTACAIVCYNITACTLNITNYIDVNLTLKLVKHSKYSPWIMDLSITLWNFVPAYVCPLMPFVQIVSKLTTILGDNSPNRPNVIRPMSLVSIAISKFTCDVTRKCAPYAWKIHFVILISHNPTHVNRIWGKLPLKLGRNPSKNVFDHTW